MLAVPPLSSSAYFWFRCLSQTSEYKQIILCYLPSKCISTGEEEAQWRWHLLKCLTEWFLSPSVNRCWGCHSECWFVFCCWPWPSVSQVTYRLVTITPTFNMQSSNHTRCRPVSKLCWFVQQVPFCVMLVWPWPTRIALYDSRVLLQRGIQWMMFLLSEKSIVNVKFFIKMEGNSPSVSSLP